MVSTRPMTLHHSKTPQLHIINSLSQQKSPPTEEEIIGFIAIVKECLANSRAEGIEDVEVCVHCHYGFNRTGFAICCWLIEVEGYGVKEALEAFKSARPNGIRHVRMTPLFVVADFEILFRLCIGDILDYRLRYGRVMWELSIIYYINYSYSASGVYLVVC